MKHLLLIAFTCFILISCSKSRADSLSDTSKPNITIIAPVTSEIYRTGDPLCFKGNVIDDNALKSVTLKLFQANNMYKPVIEYNYPVAGRFIVVEEKTIIPAALNGNCVLQFEATDAGNNKAITTLNFSSN